MLIGICSDSHDHVPHLQKVAARFREKQVGLVLHAGDYCSPFTIPHFEGLSLHGVLGNNDGDLLTLQKKFDSIGAVLHGSFCSLKADKQWIALYHGTISEITDALIRCGTYDVVISGHTHQPSVETVGKTLSINPGSLHGFDGDAMAAFYDTETRKVTFLELT